MKKPYKEKLENILSKVPLLKELEDDWDDNEGLAIKPQAIDAAIHFVRTVFTDLYDNHGIKLKMPYFNPCCDGSLDVSDNIKQDHIRFLINFYPNPDGIVNPSFVFFHKEDGKIAEPHNKIKGRILNNNYTDIINFIIEHGKRETDKQKES